MVTKNTTNRWIRFTVALLLVFTSLLPLLAWNNAEAYTLPDNRFIQLSSSARAATDVTYLVSFTPNQGGSTTNIGGMVIEFCSDTPLIGDTCAAPAGFNAHAFTGDNTLALANQVGITDWQVNTTNATANRVVLSRTGGAQALNPATVTTVSFEMGAGGASDGIDNPTATNPDNSSDNLTFYARILTFDTQVGAEQYASADIDNSGANTVVDAGGIALSTAEQITITAKVPEKITFCVFTQDDTGAPNTCGTGTGANNDLGGNSVTLGNDKGVLQDNIEFVDKNTHFTLTSNALYGVTVRLTGSTLKTSPACAEPAANNCSITAIGAAAAASAPSTEQFGMCLYDSAGAGTLTPSIPYDHADCNLTTQTAGGAVGGGAATAQFAFDNEDTGDGDATVSTYGDVIATTGGNAVEFTTATLAFIGNISSITEPGIYTTTLTFIATGEY